MELILAWQALRKRDAALNELEGGGLLARKTVARRVEDEFVFVRSIPSSLRSTPHSNFLKHPYYIRSYYCPQEKKTGQASVININYTVKAL